MVSTWCDHESIIADLIDEKFHLCLQRCLRGIAFEWPFHRANRCITRVFDTQKKNIPEAKIVTRFWIVGILLAILSLATLKLR